MFNKIVILTSSLLSLSLLVFNMEASALIIDDFDLPDPGDIIIFNITHTNPALSKKTTGGIVGGERDAYFEARNGPVDPITLMASFGTVGGYGWFNCATGPGPEGTDSILQYDGIDADDPFTPALVNAYGLSNDITEGGINDSFLFRFTNLDGGFSDVLDLNITVTGTSGGVASTTAYFPDSGTVPVDHYVLFRDFTVTGVNPFAEVSSLTFNFNSDYTAAVDFAIDSITTTTAIPEPSTAMLFGSALFGFAGFMRRKGFPPSR